MACKRLSDLETNDPMADFVARNIPNGLLERSKAAAALSGLDLREWLVSAAQEKLERMVVNGVEQAVRAPLPEEPVVVEVLEPCEACKGPMIPCDGGAKCRDCRRMVWAEGKDRTKLTAGEFMELSNSEQMRAKREGRF